MEFKNILLIISIILAVFSFILASNSLGLTGFATASNVTYGKVNLTVQTNLLINFSLDTIEWGTGRLLTGNNVTLDSSKQTDFTAANGSNKSIGGNF